MNCYNNIMIDFKEIVENSEQSTAVADLDGNILYKNKAFSALFGNDFVFPSNSSTIEKNGKKYCANVRESSGYKILTLSSDSENLEDTYTDFISTVSHELRTPLTSIRGFADTMLNSYEKLDKDQMQKFLTIIKDQSNRLIKLIENLLSISKLQSEKENLIYKTIDTKSAVEQILFMIKNQADGHSFKFECREGTLSVLVDENKFQQIMINLLDNAIKYSDENTQITITAESSSLKNMVDIKIEDEGAGIPEEYIGRIFDKFARVENHLTRKAQGSGLGLYIVKNLVEKMGGKITVESTPNKGSTFVLNLPAADYTTQSGKKLTEEKFNA